MNLKQKFRSAIRRGTGEAHLIIKKNPKVDFSKEIIKAAVFNFAYDQQSEGSRDIYIAELIDLSFQKDEIFLSLYEALKNEESHDDWSTEHLLDIVTIFAKQGDKIAKQRIYECFDKYAKTGDWVGGYAIAEIDGLKGLLYVAEKKGEFFFERL